MGGNAPSVKYENVVLNQGGPVILSGALDLTANGVAAPFNFLAPVRMELKFARYRISTAATATSTTLLLGVLGDNDEFLTSGYTQNAAGVYEIVGQGLTDQYLEVDEVVQVTVTGTATTAGAGWLTMGFTPVRI